MNIRHSDAPDHRASRRVIIRVAACIAPALVLASTVAPLRVSAAAARPEAASARVTTNVPTGFQSKTADLNGVQIHYVMGGSGPPILLIHGWPETWYEWRKVMPLLAKQFTVVAADLRGFGDSTSAPTGYDKKTLATDMHALMRSLQFPKAVVVGHDWGGPVAYAYAAQYREAVDKLVMIEGLPFGPWMPTLEPYWFFSFLRVPGYAEQVLAGKEREFLTYFYGNEQFHVVPGSFTPDSVDVYVKSFSRAGRMQPSYGLYRTIEQDVADNVEFAKTPLQLPVLAIAAQAGAGEFAFKAAQQVANHVTPVLMRQTGHFIPEERPDVLAQLLADFVAGKPIAPIWAP